MPRHTYHTPNARNELIDNWHREGRVRAIGALTLAGGLMAGKKLATILGISPRGLRQFLLKDELIKVEMHPAEEGGFRGETWYRLNFAVIPPAMQPPVRLARKPRSMQVGHDNWSPVALLESPRG